MSEDCVVGRVALALDLELVAPNDHVVATENAVGIVVETPEEAILRNAVTNLLQEIVNEEESAHLRDICQETLALKQRMEAIPRSDVVVAPVLPLDSPERCKSARNLLLPPKSPQERLMGLVPAAIEKGRMIYNRRNSPTADNFDVPLWRRADSDEQPITDIAIMFTGDGVPDGFTKIERSPSGQRADLNKGGGGVFVYLCVSRDTTDNKVPISEIAAIFPDRGEFIPTDYEVIQRRGVPANLNTGTQGEKIFLCYKRSANSSIQDIAVLFPRKGDRAPYGYIKIDKSPEGHFADLNATTGGTEVNICYKKKVIRMSINGLNSSVLHAISKTLIFIGDFDVSLVKSLEDEMLYKIMNRYETERTQNEFMKSQQERLYPVRTSQEIARDVVRHLIDAVSDGVEVAKVTENLLGTFKSHASIHSPNFYPELVAGLDQVVTSTAESNAFQLVITLTKFVSRRAHLVDDQVSDHDHVSIINSLRALNVALLAAGQHTKDERQFGQLIRRFVFPTATSTALVWSPGIFRASLTLISTLWNHYRRHLKVEFALLFEHLFLRILRHNSPCAVDHQLDIMDEIAPWFQLPHNVVEMFLNFDMDRVQQWKIFEHLCIALCGIAEGSNGNRQTATEDSGDETLRLRIQAISTIVAIARSVMDISGHAHLINRDARTRHLSMDHGGWEQDEVSEDSTLFADSVPSSSKTDVENSSASVNPSPSRSKKAGYGTMSVRMRNEQQKRNQQLLGRAKEIASSKSLKKAIEFLVAMNFIKDTPRDISSFLRIYHDSFDESDIGDFLGEGDEDFKVQVRLTYVRAISFKGLTLVESLRHFLTNGGFRLPGEAQKIERMVEAFAQCYWEDSPTAFSSADTAMIIAYSIIMLNTDLHNPQVKKNKMSKDQFVKNNRGIDSGKDLPKKFLEEIYEDIAHHPMQIRGSRFVPKSRESALSLVDLDTDKFRISITRSVTQSIELMKDLSQSYYTFNFVGVDTSISPELTKLLFERIWFLLLGVSTSILCDNQSDLTLTLHCLDLLRFSISTCLFLDLPFHRRAFCNLLSKVQNTLRDKPIPEVDEDGEGSESVDGAPAEWVDKIETAAARDDPWQVMGDIHLLVTKMKETIQRRQRSEELNSVVKRIYRGHWYLKDTTHFIREGDLTKKCRSRNQLYRFFLFNDQLIYADRGMGGYWYPHNALRLKVTRIIDISDTMLTRHAFQINSSPKSFIVYAESANAKIEWMRLIQDAIADASKQILRNARRLSHRTMPSTSELATIPAPPSPSALASSASSAMRSLIRRSSRLSSPTSEEAVRQEVSPRSGPTKSPLLRDSSQLTSDSPLEGLVQGQRSPSSSSEESAQEVMGNETPLLCQEEQVQEECDAENEKTTQSGGRCIEEVSDMTGLVGWEENQVRDDSSSPIA
ncbi:hypothetical protein Poli38472_008518 [Pythium oligandrum]|uniref:Uncharacterized protein n=1 Tax=Pythium oligandrum TaxID=41045 RepID=A0A8K1C3P6_PYTOL|nr:hypothetical protein Poli38472_008518 [Pythium oligandrum]|eukprot:TMW55870.1 hypothetical protein Poli38472_008518 [Pythium oligandrum]